MEEAKGAAVEKAVRAIIDGDMAALRALLGADPDLVRVRSTSPHHATLLHYVAANGVEDELQRSPANAPAIARVLLEAGADPDAECECYGGRWTTLDLLLSSSHPAERGVQADLVEVLCRGGAKANGPDDDGAPLWTAITWGYTGSARRLVSCGALVDNVIAAAVVGEVADMDRYFGADGRLLPVASLRGQTAFSHGRPVDLQHLLEYALIYAASHGRRDAVEWLLQKGPDLSVKEPVYGGTAVSMARYRHPAAGRPDGSPDVVALLEAWSKR
jgi:hypothetical protein